MSYRNRALITVRGIIIPGYFCLHSPCSTTAAWMNCIYVGLGTDFLLFAESQMLFVPPIDDSVHRKREGSVRTYQMPGVFLVNGTSVRWNRADVASF